MKAELRGIAREDAEKAYARGWGDIDDLHSEALYAAFKSAQTFDPEKGVKAGAWCRICVRNALVEVRRRFGRVRIRPRHRYADGILDRKTPDPQDDAQRNEFWASAAACLPPPLLAPVLLVYRDGLSQDEAAKRLGVSQMTVSKRLTRARQELRETLEGHAPCS